VAIAKAFVILELDYDTDLASGPESWEWHALLDLSSDEKVAVNVFPSESDMFQALYERGMDKGIY